MSYQWVHVVFTSFDTNRFYVQPVQLYWVGMGKNNELPLDFRKFPVRAALQQRPWKTEVCESTNRGVGEGR
jgi:hypothetical protein